MRAVGSAVELLKNPKTCAAYFFIMYTIHNKKTRPPSLNQKKYCKRLKKQPQEIASDRFCWFCFNKRTEEKA